MKVVKAGEQPDKHYVATVQVKEVTEAYKLPVGSITGGNYQTVERHVEDSFTISVRADNYNDALRLVQEHLETAREADRS